MPKSAKLNAKEVGARIREARKARGWTQTQAAQAQGYDNPSPSLYSAWESGSRPPRLATLSDIAKALGVSVEWLITGSGTTGGADDPTPYADPPVPAPAPVRGAAVHAWFQAQTQLEEAWDQLDPHYQESVLTVMRGFTDKRRMWSWADVQELVATADAFGALARENMGTMLMYVERHHDHIVTLRGHADRVLSQLRQAHADLASRPRSESLSGQLDQLEAAEEGLRLDFDLLRSHVSGLQWAEFDREQAASAEAGDSGTSGTIKADRATLLDLLQDTRKERLQANEWLKLRRRILLHPADPETPDMPLPSRSGDRARQPTESAAGGRPRPIRDTDQRHVPQDRRENAGAKERKG